MHLFLLNNHKPSTDKRKQIICQQIPVVKFNTLKVNKATIDKTAIPKKVIFR